MSECIDSLSSTIKLNTNLEMPRIGHGTNKIKTMSDVDILVHSLNNGFRLFDTASFYGNEHLILEGIKRSNVERKDVFVTTKLWVSDFGYEECKKACQKSLETLKMDYIDLYMPHWPSNWLWGSSTTKESASEIRKETWRAMEELYKSGKVKNLGVANYTIRHLKELLNYCEIKPAVNQCEMHVFHHQQELIKFCKDEGIILQWYSPLAKGKVLECNEVLNIIEKKNKSKKLTESFSFSPAQICLHWMTKFKGTTFIIGASKKKHLDEVKEIFKISLDEEDYKILDSLDEDYHCVYDPENCD